MCTACTVGTLDRSSVGQGKWLSLGCIRLQWGSKRRTPLCVAVGPSKWLSLGYGNLCPGSSRRTPLGVAVGPRKWLSLESGDLCHGRRKTPLDVTMGPSKWLSLLCQVSQIRIEGIQSKGFYHYIGISSCNCDGWILFLVLPDLHCMFASQRFCSAVVKLEDYNVRGKKTLCRTEGEGKEKEATEANE